MKHTVRSSITTPVAAAFFVVLLQAPVMGQALSAEEKAKIKARNIALNIELGSRVITIYDRQGKVIKTVGPKGLYTQPVFSPDAKRIAVVEADLHPESTDQFAQTADIFVFDADTGPRTRWAIPSELRKAVF
jgi:hypothetical protein